MSLTIAIDADGGGHGEKRNGARPEGERRNRDEGVSGVDITTHQEPGDDGAKAPSAQSPLVQQVEIAPAPARGGEAQPGDEGKQQYEDRERNPVHVLHDIPPGLS